MIKRILFISLLQILFFSCDRNMGRKHDLFEIPEVSLSPIEAFENGTLISCYDLKVIIGSDTTFLDEYSWLEYCWLKSKKTDSIIVDSNEVQLIIPVSKQIITSYNYTARNFEIYDINWKSPGLKEDNFYYRCKNTNDLSQIRLWIEVKGKKERDLFFNKTICTR